MQTNETRPALARALRKAYASPAAIWAAIAILEAERTAEAIESADWLGDHSADDSADLAEAF